MVILGNYTDNHQTTSTTTGKPIGFDPETTESFLDYFVAALVVVLFYIVVNVLVVVNKCQYDTFGEATIEFMWWLGWGVMSNLSAVEVGL